MKICPGPVDLYTVLFDSEYFVYFSPAPGSTENPHSWHARPDQPVENHGKHKEHIGKIEKICF